MKAKIKLNRRKKIYLNIAKSELKFYVYRVTDCIQVHTDTVFTF